MDAEVLAKWKSALEGNEVAGIKFYEGRMGLKEWVETEISGDAGEDPKGYWLLDPFGVLCELYAQERPGCEWRYVKDMNCYEFVVPNSTDTRLTYLYAPDEVLEWAKLDRAMWEDDICFCNDTRGYTGSQVSEWLDNIW